MPDAVFSWAGVTGTQAVGKSGGQPCWRGRQGHILETQAQGSLLKAVRVVEELQGDGAGWGWWFCFLAVLGLH